VQKTENLIVTSLWLKKVHHFPFQNSFNGSQCVLNGCYPSWLLVSHSSISFSFEHLSSVYVTKCPISKTSNPKSILHLNVLGVSPTLLLMSFLSSCLAIPFLYGIKRINWSFRSYVLSITIIFIPSSKKTRLKVGM